MGNASPPRALLEGRPGIGKTTVTRRRIALLGDAAVPLGGFVTNQIRARGRREGFMVETLSGDRGVLAHVALPGPPRVGRYGVDLQAFERIALPALAASQPGGVVVVDELGKMELASAAFRDVVAVLWTRMWRWWPRCNCTTIGSPMPASGGLTCGCCGSPGTVATSCPSGWQHGSS